MAQIRTRKTKVNGQNGIALEITKRGKGERTADNTFLLDLFTEFKTAQEDKGNSQKTIEFYLRGYFKLCEFIDMVYMKAPAAKELGLPAPTKPTPLSDVSEKEAVNRAGGLFPISILTTDGLERDYRKYLTNLGVNEQTIAAYFRAYRAIAYFAMEEGWIPRRKISIKQPEPPIKNCYTDDEIKRLVRKPKTDDFLENRNWVMVNYSLTLKAYSIKFRHNVSSFRFCACLFRVCFPFFTYIIAHSVSHSPYYIQEFDTIFELFYFCFISNYRLFLCKP